MIPIVQLGPDNQHPFPLLITTTRKNKNPEGPPLVENFRVEEMAWSDSIGAALREAREVETAARYSESTATEPGMKPSEENVTLFVVAYPIPIIDTIPSRESEAELNAVACGALRHVEEGYMEIKRMYAIPSVRGSGAALSVLMALEYYAQKIGMKGVKLETGYLHVEAMKFYPKHGYTEIPRFGNYKDIPWSHCYQKDF